MRIFLKHPLRVEVILDSIRAKIFEEKEDIDQRNTTDVQDEKFIKYFKSIT